MNDYRVAEMLCQLSACITLKGGSMTPEFLREQKLEVILDICEKNGISVKFWPLEEKSFV